MNLILHFINTNGFVGLIDPEQMWWWKEDWQKDEREAEDNIAKGEVSESFQNVSAL